MRSSLWIGLAVAVLLGLLGSVYVVREDQTAMVLNLGKVVRAAYAPDPGRADAYDALFAEYTLLHDYFGRGGNDVMRRLRALRATAHGARTTAAPVEGTEAVRR